MYNLYVITNPTTLPESLLNKSNLATFILNLLLSFKVFTSTSTSLFTPFLVVNNVCNTTIYFIYYLI